MTSRSDLSPGTFKRRFNLVPPPGPRDLVAGPARSEGEGPLRRFGLSSLDAGVVAAIVLVLAALALAGAIGSASSP